MASTGASGTNAVSFGTMRDNVLGLTVVTAAGTVIKTGSLAAKSSSGYDLTRLFVGSEGTLGIITELTLRIHPVPDAVSAHAAFETLSGAIAAVTDIKRAGIAIGRVEFLDAALMRVIADRLPEAGFAVRPTLFFEFHGHESEVAVVSEMIADIVSEHGGGALAWAKGQAETQRLWAIRRDCIDWAHALRPGTRSLSTDVCVPVSALADAIVATHADVAASGLTAYIIGHVGDGNFHCVFKMTDAEEPAVKAICETIVLRAIAAGGTASGEHGIGLGKRGYLEREHGAEAIAVMRSLKAALDPLNILNPARCCRTCRRAEIRLP